MSTIAILATSPCYLASLGAMVDAHARLGEVFETNAALGDYSRMETKLQIAGTSPGMIKLAGGRELIPDTAFAGLALPRFVYLPSFQMPDLDRFVSMCEDLSACHMWLKDIAKLGIPIAACGTSILHLAAAGLLDSGRCAASPRLVGLLRKLAPRIEIDTDSAILHEGNLWSCSRDADNPALVARLLAECFSVELGQGLAMREPPGPAARALSIPVDPIVARAQLWIRDRFTRQFRIADLANELGLSHQTLIRRFSAAGIASPRQFVQRTRVDAAASMLVKTSRSVAEIAQLVGYADIPSFRRVFQAEMGQAPAAFRATRRSWSQRI